MEQYQEFTVALPDSAVADQLATGIQTRANVRIDHPSGRAWVLARIPTTHLVEYEDGDLRVALIGPTSATQERLEAALRTTRELRDIPDAVRGFDGSYLVLASRHGRIYASGPVFQTRRVFYAPIGGEVVIADRADLLAEVGGLEVDPTALANRLLVGTPHPFSDVPMWSEITAVPGPHYIVVNSGTDVSEGTWWHHPEPVLNRQEGAALLREALSKAVAVRHQAGAKIASDLSGGLDSTPLCYFASLGENGVLARTFYTEDPGGRDDLEWARRALVSMPGVHTHEIISTSETPDFYGGLEAMRVPLDEPSQTAVAAPRIEDMLARDRASEIDVHLHGAGGDHLMRGSAMWEHTLFRRRPLLAWRRARDEAVATETGAFTTLRQLLDRRDYPTWLVDAIRAANEANGTPTMPGAGDWSVRPAFPSWVDAGARKSAIDRLIASARTCEPLARARAHHFDLFNIYEAGRVVRSMEQVGHHHGVHYDGPLVDDHVVEAVLAVRHEERDTPIEWKPLMKAAMKNLLPDDYLRRTNKVGGSPQSLRGYAANYDQLVAIWEESGLLDTGLVDRDVLLRESKPSPTVAPPNTIHLLTDVALFLRNLSARPETARTTSTVYEEKSHGI